MNKLRSLIAILVMLPLVALGSSLGSADLGDISSVPPSEAPGGELGKAPSFDECCWIFFLGRWYCIPC